MHRRVTVLVLCVCVSVCLSILIHTLVSTLITSRVQVRYVYTCIITAFFRLYLICNLWISKKKRREKSQYANEQLVITTALCPFYAPWMCMYMYITYVSAGIYLKDNNVHV